MFELSIVIPVYNIRDYIYRCVKSITDQMDERIQVIIVDDGTPDDSIAMISDLCSGYDNVEIHHKDNGGLSSARNYGIEKAEGKYVYFVDGDDFLIDGVLSDLVDALECGMGDCYAFKHLTIEEMKSFSLGDNLKVASSVIPANDYLRDYRNPITNVWKVIVSRQLIDKEKFFFRQGVYCEDLEWLTRLFIKIDEVVWINRHIYVYDNSRSDSIMNSLSAKRIIDLDQNISLTKNLVEDVSDDEKRIILKKLLFIEWCNNLSFYAMLARDAKRHVHIKDSFSKDLDHRLFRVFGRVKALVSLDFLARSLLRLKRLRKRLKRYNFMNLIKKQIME